MSLSTYLQLLLRQLWGSQGTTLRVICIMSQNNRRIVRLVVLNLLGGRDYSEQLFKLPFLPLIPEKSTNAQNHSFTGSCTPFQTPRGLDISYPENLEGGCNVSSPAPSRRATATQAPVPTLFRNAQTAKRERKGGKT